MTDTTIKKDQPENEIHIRYPQGCTFEIRVKGQLDESWKDWLDGLEVSLLDNGEMILSGSIGDQAALMGTLNKLYGLNLTLLSVSKVDLKE